ncbi:MAG: AAA family ATPase [Candidatus Micrarchaeota archaeon]|nr:AAA family ATPase [Candidatus Micrarchaeota archaeon]
MKNLIVITGTPGVGKTTLCAQLKKKIPGSALYNATDLVNEFKLYSGKDKFGAKIVKMKMLERKINQIIKKEDSKTIIFEGHVLADLKIKGAKAVVLREHLNTIKSRLLERGYPTEKIRENIVSEALDYCGASCYDNYPNTYEIMNGKSAQNKIISIIKGDCSQKSPAINLLEELVDIIKKDRKFAI